MMVYKILSYYWFGVQETYLEIRGPWWHCFNVLSRSQIQIDISYKYRVHSCV